MTDEHPAEGRLRSYLDGELSPLARWRCAAHLRRCPSCRASFADQTRLSQRSETLLAHLELTVDVAEAWRRLRVLRGGTSPERPAQLKRFLVWGGGTALALGTLVLLRTREEPRRMPATPLATELAVVDRCCWDLDGGGSADGGILTLTFGGERVVALTVYEDSNHTQSLSAADVIRFGFPPTGAPAPGGPPPSTARDTDRPVVRDICCADYDGGGFADDGLLMVGAETDDVRRVVLYEDLDASRSFTSGDLLRWSGGAASRPWPLAVGL